MGQLLIQPRARHSPVVLDRAWRDAKFNADLLEREAAKEVKLKDARLPGIQFRKTREGFVNGQNIDKCAARGLQTLIQRDLNGARASLARAVGPRMVNQNVTHGVSRKSENP